ncbi:MAG: right-handed parallel beta-helix repeat-containing protein [Clostridia bacterium]|nr:right-handed parallel beta-helix repeat-containing protein [Clostridia bacterium]
MKMDLTAILPDGNGFEFWEEELLLDRTLHVRAENGTDASGDGSAGSPFSTINAAAAVAVPGTRVLIHGGTYRECVRPAMGGSDASRMIVYEAAGDGEVVIKASEVATAFTRSTEYAIEDDDDGTEPVIWEHRIDIEKFKGYNPFGIDNCIHEKQWLRYTRVEQKSSLIPYFLRRGAIYVDGSPLRQVQLYKLMQNDPGTYWVEENGLTIHFRMPDNGSPDGHLVEISCREQCFSPEQPFCNYIKVKGLTFLHAANGAPVPQRGALSCHRGHHWIIEDCTVQYANALGVDVGEVDWGYKKNTERQTGHSVLRRNRIYDCGVCGIAGLGATHMLVEDNLVARIGWQRMEYAWESAGLKFHRCIDSLFRRNIFRDCEGCDGIWLDVGNHNDRITQNLCMNINGPHSMVYMECCRGGELLIDNNIFWNATHFTVPQKRMKSITIDSTSWNDPFALNDDTAPDGDALRGDGTDDMSIVNNLIANIAGYGYSQNVIRGRMTLGRGGTSRNSTVLNNVFYDCRGGAIRLPTHDNRFDGNFFSKMPQGFLVLNYPAPTEQLDLAAWQRFERQDPHGGYAAFRLSVDTDHLTMTIRPDKKRIFWDDRETSGYSSMPTVEPYAKVRTDYFGTCMEGYRMPGPFNIARDEITISIDPREK